MSGLGCTCVWTVLRTFDGSPGRGFVRLRTGEPTVTVGTLVVFDHLNPPSVTGVRERGGTGRVPVGCCRTTEVR